MDDTTRMQEVEGIGDLLTDVPRAVFSDLELALAQVLEEVASLEVF